MTALVVKVIGPGKRPGVDLAGGTWAYATCGVCWRERGETPIGHYPGSAAETYYPDASVAVLRGDTALPAREFACEACAAVGASEGPQTRLLSLHGHAAHWAPSTCLGCRNQPATHLLKIYPERAAYPVVRFLCARCVRKEQGGV